MEPHSLEAAKGRGHGLGDSLGRAEIKAEDADSGVLRDKTNDVIERKEAKEAAKKNRRRKKTSASLVTARFQDQYHLNGEVLGRGAYASVQTCINTLTDIEYAVKIIDKTPGHPRARVFREVETFHHCQGHPNIIQLLEMFEDEDKFYLVFEKVNGGQLLERIQERSRFTEREAAEIMRDLAEALKYLHKKGIAHRDLKPENILCVSRDSLSPVKLCDLDLGSGVRFSAAGPMSTPRLNSPVGSAEFMAPEVVDLFLSDSPTFYYDKRCDLWSLGVILYILLCGYPPFWGSGCSGPCPGVGCPSCRDALFHEILEGQVLFDGEEWASVSPQAKDLVLKLLRVEPEKRLTAEAVLTHPWIQILNSPPEQKANSLDTPRFINRNNSVSELSSLAESAMTLNRVLVQQLSICSNGNSITNSSAGDSSPSTHRQLASVHNSALLQRRQQTQTV